MDETPGVGPLLVRDPEQDLGSTLPRRQLGRRLRELRERAGLSTDAAGHELEWSRTKIWRIETGQTSVRAFDVKAMCEVYGASDENFHVRVLPFSAGTHKAMMTGFTYMRFREPNEPDVIYIETRTGALYLEKAKERRSYRAAMRDVSQRALPEDASREMIAAVAKEFASCSP